MDTTTAIERPAPFIRTPAFVNRFVSPVIMRLGIATTLITTGRTSGHARSVPVTPIEVAGVRYLVAASGLSNWARNLRASGSCELRRRGTSEFFMAVEVADQERDRVVEAYRDRASRQVRRLFTQIPNPGDHPTFRLEPGTSSEGGVLI